MLPACADTVGSLGVALVPNRYRGSFFTVAKSAEGASEPANPVGKALPAEIYERAQDFWDAYAEVEVQVKQLLSATPKLLWSAFRFLLPYPELTTFAVRVKGFQERARSLRRHGGKTRIRVRRSNIVEDSVAQLRAIEPEQLLNGFHVEFVGEGGVDMRGLTKDWLGRLVRELLNPDLGLFRLSANKATCQPSSLSGQRIADHLKYFEIAGRIIARALVDGICVPANLTPALRKHLLQLPLSLSLKDIEGMDPELYKSLLWIRRNDVTDLEQYFTQTSEDKKDIPLFEGGEDKLVTNENKEEYVRLVVQNQLKGFVKDQVEHFVNGFYSIIPFEMIHGFTPVELDLIICGMKTINVDELRKGCKYVFPFHDEHPLVQMFFSVIGKWDNEQLSKLLSFITSSSQVPIAGYDGLILLSPLLYDPNNLGPKNLPSSHTCTSTLDIPPYETEDEFSGKLLMAVYESDSIELQ
jgi:E3 ubiquitin-protein ligase HUWE1